MDSAESVEGSEPKSKSRDLNKDGRGEGELEQVEDIFHRCSKLLLVVIKMFLADKTGLMVIGLPLIEKFFISFTSSRCWREASCYFQSKIFA